MKLLKYLKSILKEDDKFNMYNKNYEHKLYKKYGKCRKINSAIKLLVIADTHGTLNELEFKEFVNSLGEFDVCIMLGDHYDRDINIILNYIDKEKIYGVLGNINGKVININGVKILGMEGSFRYKPVKFPSFTHEESIDFFSAKETVDILVSHDTKFNLNKSTRDPAHQGLIGITNYLYENKIPIHIHGHIFTESLLLVQSPQFID